MYTEPLQNRRSLPDCSGVSGTKNSTFFISCKTKKLYLSTQEWLSEVKSWTRSVSILFQTAANSRVLRKNVTGQCPHKIMKTLSISKHFCLLNNLFHHGSTINVVYCQRSLNATLWFQLLPRKHNEIPSCQPRMMKKPQASKGSKPKLSKKFLVTNKHFP